MLKIHQLRNATIVLEVNDQKILVDPMLGDQASMPPFAFIRYKAHKNPTVPLPNNADETLKDITHCVITHNHPDHLDNAGEAFLKEHDIPVWCSYKDVETFKKRGLRIKQPVKYWKKSDFAKGTIEGIPARHGYGMVAKLLGNVMGFYIQFRHAPSVYLTSDTIYTRPVNYVLSKYKPAVCVVPGGLARFDLFKHLIMNENDLLNFTDHAPGKVIINHLEAINHCPATRAGLRDLFDQAELENKVLIPEDGENMLFKSKLNGHKTLA
ncbi:MBL fold metallo-hydrolase [Gracilimonas mengyeensis]|uniref:Beta-lactamase superfamily domain-containing protein n=1 Tax=Gracilimonas mengyeensis TaxID=1302730 RepID=A0A521E984_9BACT|nr:MBL fold metallo-hydrolase [Gracilimonas mengyeensis]SMO80487.1 Beta-lactamase superfamily domain-containing protein [Gracilimonas mengyeensis]